MDTENIKPELLHKNLFEIWRSASTKNRNRYVLNHVIQHLNLKDCSYKVETRVKKIVTNFCGHLKSKWTESRCILQRFRKKHVDWLNMSLLISQDLLTSSPTSASKEPSQPRKPFAECTAKTKRRRVLSLTKEASSEELAFAARLKLRKDGKRNAAEIIKQVTEGSPEVTVKLKKALRKPNISLPIRMSPEKALASFVNKKMTKQQYIDTRLEVKELNADVYPPYNYLVEAKKECYPDGLKITDISGEIPLQSLLDHTIRRLIAVQREVLIQQNLGVDASPQLNIIFKWGCDGAGGQSNYKQSFSGETETERFDDSNLFLISIVPLQLTAQSYAGTSKGQNKLIIWQNPRPSSIRYCRPIKLIFKKEDAALIRTEVQNIEKQIQCLSPTTINLETVEISVKQTLVLTMVDGKVCSVLSEQSSQKCYICKANPSQMNDLSRHKASISDESAISFGISSLHAWIRCLECILHLSYRLQVKKWQVRKTEREAVDARKKHIQDRLRKELSLLVDIPKPGFGTTNDGNTARRFFANPQVVSDITGVDEELITRLGVILRTIACGYQINTDAFKTYTLETAQVYLKYYDWYYMPVTVHKILIHRVEIIKSAILPIGQLSEEAQEARNKDCRRFREHHTRKFSRKQTIEDLMHMLLITSDPLISSFREPASRKSSRFPKEVLSMLAAPKVSKEDGDSSDQDAEFVSSDSDHDNVCTN